MMARRSELLFVRQSTYMADFLPHLFFILCILEVSMVMFDRSDNYSFVLIKKKNEQTTQTNMNFFAEAKSRQENRFFLFLTKKKLFLMNKERRCGNCSKFLTINKNFFFLYFPWEFWNQWNRTGNQCRLYFKPFLFAAFNWADYFWFLVLSYSFSIFLNKIVDVRNLINHNQNWITERKIEINGRRCSRFFTSKTILFSIDFTKMTEKKNSKKIVMWTKQL